MKEYLINKKGFTMVEMMVVSVILAFIMGGIYMTLSAGRDSFLTTSTQINLNDSLRMTAERVAMELRQSGSTAGAMQLTIFNGTGVGGSDIIRFSIPVVCQSTGSLINASGDVANWRAPLTWGCTTSACMDADNDCNTIDYKYIEYRLDSSNRLVRRVLDNAAVTVREDIFAQRVSDFQATLSNDQNVVTLVVTAQETNNLNRSLSTSNTINVYLRNRG